VNFGQLQSLVSYYLDDLQFTYFTPTQVQRFINDAQREVQQKLLQAGQNFYLTCVQTPTVANQEGLALPDDFLKVEHCQIITGGTYPNEQYTVLTHSTHRESDFVNYAPSIAGHVLFAEELPDFAAGARHFHLHPAPALPVPGSGHGFSRGGAGRAAGVSRVHRGFGCDRRVSKRPARSVPVL
jgi:hypothetical protein